MPDIIIDRKQYDATIALNYSGSKELLKSPAHYKAYLAKPREETKALRVGSFVHHLALEGDRTPVGEKFAATPEGIDRRTKEGKAAYEAFTATSIGKTILSSDEWAMGHSVAESISAARASLGVKFTSTEFMFSVDYCGVKLKCAIDALGDDGYLYDLKTTEDASPRGFLQSARNYRYNLQAYFYRLAYEAAFGKRVNGFRFIAAEKEAPFEYAIYELGPELMTNAAFDFEKAVASFKSCSALDEWPGYGSDVKVIDINSPNGNPAPAPIQFA
jgi:exodeoxyribonuclease VIII